MWNFLQVSKPKNEIGDCVCSRCHKKCGNKGALASHKLSCFNFNNNEKCKNEHLSLKEEKNDNNHNVNNISHELVVLSSQDVEYKTEEKDLRKGQKKRTTYKLDFKMEIITKYEKMLQEGAKPNDAANKISEELEINSSNVFKWHGKKDQIQSSIADLGRTNSKRRRNILSSRKAKYPECEEKLFQEFEQSREQGRKINQLWFKLKFKAILIEKKPVDYENFKYSCRWIENFCDRYDITYRMKTNNKVTPIIHRVNRIQKFHQWLHEVRNSGDQIDEKYGRFHAFDVFHMDEVPIPFVFDADSTYEIKGTKRVWIKQPGTGLDKRQATAILTFRASEEQNVIPMIIFRGTGKCIQQSEIAQYPSNVRIIWQANAWCDENVMIEYLRKFRALTGDKNEKLLVLDNCEAHQTETVKSYAKHHVKALLAFTPAECTDAVSVVDRIAHVFKSYVATEYELWAEKHFNEWELGIAARDRRILLSKWISRAWNHIQHKSDFIIQMFNQTGILLAKDGSEDSLIKIQGIENYSVFPKSINNTNNA